MTTSTIRSERRARGFTLVEVMIAATLGTFVLAGVLSTFLMLGRSGANVANYSVMESQARRALEEFSQDLRMSSGITWNSASSITLTVPNNYTPTSGVVTYYYDSTAKTFNRRPKDSSTATGTTTFISNVTSFAYSRYDRINNAATLDTTTKRIQLNMTASTANVTRTVPGASNIIVSASFILRNKYAN
ncbi:MAG: prepilin-type N-terminal cleavage/methylation domain-containing protein [Verrucomicrobia bacterium]|nr:prepilin-type N-terminal cleavage/methylation domain-containing protein [Verrucomicrobiota bacterium]